MRPRRHSTTGDIISPRRLSDRFRTLRGTYLNHRFERSSPLPELPAELMGTILDRTVALPPPAAVGRPGMQSLDGLVFLAALVRWLRPARVLEIGTFQGVTTACLALNMEGGYVHTIDLPEEIDPALPTESSDEFRASSRAPMCYEDPALQLRAGIHQHWGDSATFDFDSSVGESDLVYVDGAHSAPYVRRDSETAFRLLSPRGAIVWDDYWRQSEGVAKVLHELAEDRRLWRVPDTRLVLYVAEGALASGES